MNKKRRLVIESNEISEMKTLTLNGFEQKVLIEGKNKNLPLVICLHGGPGSPIPFSVGCRGMFPDFTDKFIMVYWDQLGCGINNYKIDNTFTIKHFVDMTVSLIKEMKTMFPENKLFLFAVSWGSILSANAAALIPQLIDGVVVYGQVYKTLAFNEDAFAALEVATVKPKTKQLIADFKAKKHYTKADFMTFTGLLRKYTDGYQNKNEKPTPIGELIMGLLTSPDYKLCDFLAIVINGYAKNESIMQELTSIDLSRTLVAIKTPYCIVQGATDIITSTKAIAEFVETSNSDNLHCDIIKNSGHLPSDKAMGTIIEKLTELCGN